MEKAFADPSQATQRKAAGDYEKLIDRRFVDALGFVMGDERGRLFVAELLYSVCHLGQESWLFGAAIKDGVSAFAHVAYHQGAMHPAKVLEQMLEEICPNDLDRMESEHKARVRIDARATQATTPKDDE